VLIKYIGLVQAELHRYPLLALFIEFMAVGIAIEGKKQPSSFSKGDMWAYF
jgi:hypothetical protein